MATMKVIRPPFTPKSAAACVRLAEDSWNACDVRRIAMACTVDTWWRNRSEFLQGRAAVASFLERQWARELGYRMVKELWAFSGNHVAVRFAYEWHDDSGSWFRSLGNEQWRFAADGLMRRREASINDLRITAADRRFDWPAGPRPTDLPGLTDLGL